MHAGREILQPYPDFHGRSKTGTMKEGLVMLYVGNGAAPVSPALGQVFRALGRGWKVCVVRFVEGLESLDGLQGGDRHGNQVEILGPSRGFSSSQEDAERRKQAVQGALEAATQRINEGKHELVMLDGLLNMIDEGLLEEREVKDLLVSRNAAVHVLVTGNEVSPSLKDLADLVTEVACLGESDR
jgi:cob(I)alamin adenosyltransferase